MTYHDNQMSASGERDEEVTREERIRTYLTHSELDPSADDVFGFSPAVTMLEMWRVLAELEKRRNNALNELKAANTAIRLAKKRQEEYMRSVATGQQSFCQMR